MTSSAVHVRTGFCASAELAGSLQQLLVDLIALHLQGKQAHWNVVGRNFRDLHLQLDEIVDSAREASDNIAERMRALGATPDGRAPAIVQTAALSPFPPGEQDSAAVVDLMTDRLYAVAGAARAMHTALTRRTRPRQTCCMLSSWRWRSRRGCSAPRTALSEPGPRPPRQLPEPPRLPEPPQPGTT